MASNLKNPEDSVLYFIRGDQLGLVTTFSSSSETRTSRKAYQAIDHSVTNGLLIHYYGNPKTYIKKAMDELMSNQIINLHTYIGEESGFKTAAGWVMDDREGGIFNI